MVEVNVLANHLRALRWHGLSLKTNDPSKDQLSMHASISWNNTIALIDFETFVCSELRLWIGLVWTLTQCLTPKLPGEPQD